MSLAKSALSVTNFDDYAVHRQAAELRARFFRSCANRAWKALRRHFAHRSPRGSAHGAPHGAAHA